MGTEKGIQLFALISLLAALAGCASHPKPDRVSVAEQSGLRGTKWGYYNGEPVTKWNSDGRTMTLLTELRYTDPQGEVWVAPIGSATLIPVSSRSSNERIPKRGDHARPFKPPHNVILSEAKNLGSILDRFPQRKRTEMFRFAQHDSAICETSSGSSDFLR